VASLQRDLQSKSGALHGAALCQTNSIKICLHTDAAIRDARAKTEQARAHAMAASTQTAPSSIQINGGTLAGPDLSQAAYKADVPVTGSGTDDLLRDVYAMMTRPPGQRIREQISHELHKREAIYTPEAQMEAAHAQAAAAAARSAARPTELQADSDDEDLTADSAQREARRKVSAHRQR